MAQVLTKIILINVTLKSHEYTEGTTPLTLTLTKPESSPRLFSITIRYGPSSDCWAPDILNTASDGLTSEVNRPPVPKKYHALEKNSHM